MSSIKFINALFVLLLISSASIVSTKTDLESQDYVLLFELDDEDLPDLDKFSDVFDFSEEDQQNEEEILEDREEEDQETGLVKASDLDLAPSKPLIFTKPEYNEGEISLSNDDEVADYIVENEDYIDDLTYFENIDIIKQHRREENELKSLGRRYRGLIAKMMVHTAFRNSPIYYSQSVSF
mmetsp:Transcript_29200/g.30322  ORF Transcript_29200/g.30322 Transcript_29200/m.30322 type:complete len:181 (-) Transcript_29200:144-686(-)